MKIWKGFIRPLFLNNNNIIYFSWCYTINISSLSLLLFFTFPYSDVCPVSSQDIHLYRNFCYLYYILNIHASSCYYKAGSRMNVKLHLVTKFIFCNPASPCWIYFYNSYFISESLHSFYCKSVQSYLKTFCKPSYEAFCYTAFLFQSSLL